RFTVAGADAIQPALGAVEPAYGLVDVTTPVVIHGSGFRATTRAFVAGIEASIDAEHSTATELHALVPPSPTLRAGAALVEVRDASGLFSSRLGAFVYRDRLRLLSLVPNRSPQRCGVLVELRGACFAP